MRKTAPISQIAITGVGVVSACGIGLTSLESALQQGREGLSFNSLWESELTKTFPVGQVNAPLNGLESVTIRHGFDRQSRTCQLAMIAAYEAINMAGITDAGLILGQSVCGTHSSEDAYIALKNSPRADLRGMLQHSSSQIIDTLAASFGLSGPTLSVLTACSSAANAIGMAAETIANGQSEIMLAGGADSLSKIAFNGFCGLKVTSPDGPRPFDANRQGMMVGEGAGLLVLESIQHAQSRGAEILGLLSGWGHSCDAHHLTAPHPEGTGAKAAMRQALEHAGINAADVGYVNAHGTATIDNDKVEAAAIAEVLGTSVPVSSTKRYTGHTLAAAGGIEAVISLLALKGLQPANLGTSDIDSDINVLLENEQRNVNHVLSNSFGFGGNNAALVFSRPEFK
ncbi:beta-ketoacyl-[acyl-carrier-protein] synthase family protein [Planctomycetota bacterium]|nr:beta-ketoacyl-[acyl-carrier-protein] synthase family protein [Planctomycetota bacterium]